MVMWQLKATLPSSQSVRKNATTLLVLPDDFNSHVLNIVLIKLEATKSIASPTSPDPLRALRTPVSPHLQSQEKSHCPTKGHFPQPSCADQWRHMLFTVSAETQGPNSTNSLRTIGSFFNRKKKRSPYGPYLPGTFHCEEVVRRRTLSQASRKGLRPLPTTAASDLTPPYRWSLLPCFHEASSQL